MSILGASSLVGGSVLSIRLAFCVVFCFCFACLHSVSWAQSSVSMDCPFGFLYRLFLLNRCDIVIICNVWFTFSRRLLNCLAFQTFDNEVPPEDECCWNIAIDEWQVDYQKREVITFVEELSSNFKVKVWYFT